MHRRIIVTIVVALGSAVAFAAGTATEQTFFSQALGEERTALVYLPEDYDSSRLDYPVIFFLHGADGGVGSWYLTGFTAILDEMIGGGLIDPVIVVEPDSATCPAPPEWQALGVSDRIFSNHSDSELLGHNETYLAEDLVAWVDTTYRTRADREHRWLFGRSVGGHGAIRLALRHPEIFGGASIDAGFMAVAEGYLPGLLPYLTLFRPGPPYDFAPTNGPKALQVFSICAAFTANLHNPPWYVDFILDDDGTINEEVEQRLLAQSPPALVHAYAGSEYPLDLFLRIGDTDEFADTFWPVIDALESEGVPHLVRTYAGSHWTPSLGEKLAVHLTYLTPIKASAEISPRVADPRLYPQTLRVVLELPGELDVADVDCATLALIAVGEQKLSSPVPFLGAECEIENANGNGRDDLTAWLPCTAVVEAAVAGGVSPGEQVTLTVRGELSDGRFFRASDSVTLASDPAAVFAVD